ncbi:MAG: hypothetical protein ACKV2U_29340 [Bryobacteraceae bacterium]
MNWILYANLVAAGVLLSTSLVIAYQNLGSRNIPLGTGALTAAVIAFLLQIFFDLRSSARNDQVGFAYTLDFHDGEIRQWDYTKVIKVNNPGDTLDGTRTILSGRIPAELEASRWLFAQHKDIAEQNQGKVASDFALFSLVAFFVNGGANWQWEFRRYNSPTISFGRFVPTSNPRQCSVITLKDLRQQMVSAGNLFADAPLFSRDVCLPVETTMQVGRDQIVIQNAVLQIVFKLEDPGTIGGDYVRPPGPLPETGYPLPLEVPKLKDGRFRYDTRVQSFVIQTKFSALRAYDLERPTYEAWSIRLIETVKAWFACC